MNTKNMKRNGQIDFLKFIFALMIVIYHFGNRMQTTNRIFSRGYIGVEFFFIVSGYLLAVSMEKVKNQEVNTKELVTEWKAFIKKKYIALWPVYFFAYVLSMLTCAYYLKWTPVHCVKTVFDSIPELFLVQMAGFQEDAIVGQAWYLSAMLLVMLVLYPMLRKYYDWMTKIIAPAAAALLIFYLQMNYNNLDVIVEKNWFFYAGILRAAAELMLGIFMHRVGKKMHRSIHTSSKWTRVLLTGIELLCYGAFIRYAYRGGNTRWEFLLIFIVAIAIAISFSGKSYLERLFQHEIFGYLGKISFPIYLNQIWVRMILLEQGFTVGWTKYMLITVVATIAVSIVTLFIVDILRGIRRGSEKDYYRQISLTGERK